jgi:hypothetical protein
MFSVAAPLCRGACNTPTQQRRGYNCRPIGAAPTAIILAAIRGLTQEEN